MTPVQPMPDIFISYRRGDSAGHAGRLYDGLLSRFGEGNVFIDVDAIAPGVDFVERIRDAVASCDVILVLIGEEWISMTGADGARRIDDPDDFVRLEINAALERGIPIIPVLVEGARMPGPHELPEDIGGLARQNAIELSDARWHYDVSRLIEAISRLKPDEQRSRPAAAVGATGPKRGLLIGGVVALIAVIAIAVVALGGGGGGSKTKGSATTTPALNTAQAGVVATGHPLTGVDGGLDVLWGYDVSGTVRRFDPKSGKPLGDPVSVGQSVENFAAGQNAAWANSEKDRSVIKLDQTTGKPTSTTLSLPTTASYIAAGGGAVWVSVQQRPGLLRFDPSSGKQVKAFDIPPPGDIATGDLTVAVLDQGKVLFVDPDTNAIESRVPVAETLSSVVLDANDDAWIACPDKGAVAHVAQGHKPTFVNVDGSPNQVVTTANGIWALDLDGDNDQPGSSLLKIDPDTEKVSGSPIDLGPDVEAAAAIGDAVWVAYRDGRLRRISA